MPVLSIPGTFQFGGIFNEISPWCAGASFCLLPSLYSAGAHTQCLVCYWRKSDLTYLGSVPALLRAGVVLRKTEGARHTCLPLINIWSSLVNHKLPPTVPLPFSQPELEMGLKQLDQLASLLHVLAQFVCELQCLEAHSAGIVYTAASPLLTLLPATLLLRAYFLIPRTLLIYHLLSDGCVSSAQYNLPIQAPHKSFICVHTLCVCACVWACVCICI